MLSLKIEFLHFTIFHVQRGFSSLLFILILLLFFVRFFFILLLLSLFSLYHFCEFENHLGRNSKTSKYYIYSVECRVTLNGCNIRTPKMMSTQLWSSLLRGCQNNKTTETCINKYKSFGLEHFYDV